MKYIVYRLAQLKLVVIDTIEDYNSEERSEPTLDYFQTDDLKEALNRQKTMITNMADNNETYESVNKLSVKEMEEYQASLEGKN